MKVVALVVLALAIFGASAVDVAGDVRKEIEAILDKIDEPLIDIHDIKYSLDLLIEKVSIDVKDIVLKGIKKLDITQLDYDETTSRLDYELTFGEIEADVDLEAELSGLINIDHHPTAKVSLTDLKLAGYSVVDVESTPNQLTDFKLSVTLGGAEVKLSNILNDDELSETLEKVLNEKLPTIVNNIAASLEPFVSPIVKSAINIILSETDSE